MLLTKDVGVWLELLGDGPVTNTPSHPLVTPTESVAIRPPVAMMYLSPALYS